MKTYRIITFETASIKHEYRIEAATAQEARRMVTDPTGDEDPPESESSEIHEYTGDVFVESVTEIGKTSKD